MQEINTLTTEEVSLVSGGINVDNYTPKGDIWDHGRDGNASASTPGSAFWYAYRAAMYAMNQ